MNPKEKFLDRMEQAFTILVNRKDLLIGGAFIYGGIPIIMMILWKIFISFVVFDAFFTHSMNYIIIILGLLVWLAIICIQIGIFLGFIKYVDSLYKGIPADLQSSMTYGIQKIWASCYIYYYIFLYTLLIPSLFFIGGLLLILIDLMQGKINWVEGLQSAQYANIGLIFLGISLCLTLYFAIYRGIKSAFAIYKAIDSDDFTRKSFEDSIRLSDNQWIRIFGNLVGVALITGLALSVFNGVFSIGGSAVDMNSIIGMRTADVSSIKYIMQNISPISIGIVLSSALGGIGYIFSIAFTYLFFKRLEMETGGENIIREKVKVDIIMSDL